MVLFLVQIKLFVGADYAVFNAVAFFFYFVVADADQQIVGQLVAWFATLSRSGRRNNPRNFNKKICVFPIPML